MTTTGSSGSKAAGLFRRRTTIVLIAVITMLLGMATAASAAKRVQISDVAVTDITEMSATISWSTNGRTSGLLRYGTTTAYGLQVDAPNQSSSQSVSLTGLSPDTVYYFEIEARTKSGRTATSQGWFTTTADEPPPPPPPPSGDSFSCLTGNAITNVDDTWAGQNLVGRIRPGDVGAGTAIDLRGTTISVHDRDQDAVVDGKPVVDSRWGLVQTDSSVDMCVAGGEIVSPDNPYNITWDENYDTEGIGLGYRLGTTRNHTAVDAADAIRPVVSGMYFFNLHDGPRFNAATDWRAQHLWGEYTRDDCIENDQLASGVIADSLFDGCYTGYSNRPTDNTLSGTGNTVTFDNVLLRMEMMPGPYKACERADQYYDVNRDPYQASPCVERQVYGTGHLFKLKDQSDATGSDNPMFNFIDSVFVVEQVPAGDRRADFPPASKIDQCTGVVVIYLGDGAYPGRLPPAGCHTLYANGTGLDVWQTRVEAWHAAHPDVAPDRKDPTSYGDVTFPRPPFNDPEVD